MKLPITIFFIFLSLFVYNQKTDDCNNPTTTSYSKMGWIKVPKEIKLFKIVDMGGVSDHSKQAFLNIDHKFKYHKIETKKPKIRYIYNCVKGRIIAHCDSNDDTGNDHLKIFGGDSILLDVEFGREATYKIDFDFGNGQAIIPIVYSNGTPNMSAGAFQVTLLIWYIKEIYVWKRVELNYSF